MTNPETPVFLSIKLNKMTKEITKYSDQELEEFKTLIDNKIAKAAVQLLNLQDQLENVNENDDDGYDPDDNSSSFVDREFLQEMVHRQRKHIQDLQNALLRIKNKTFGVCIITGELIDKKRLIAVPTTTKSLAAKLNPIKPQREEKQKVQKKNNPVITTKIHKKPTVVPQSRTTNSNDLATHFVDDEENDEDWKTVPFNEEMEGLE